MLRCSKQLGSLLQHGHPKQAAKCLAGLAHLLHDSAATSKTCVGAANGRSSSSRTWDLYSMNTSEVQQQAYLQAAAAAQQVAEEAASAGGEQLSHDDRVEVVRRAVEELAAEAIECAACPGACPQEPDFYESTQDFAPDRQLVLRSAWLCAGATSLAGMRARLQQRISFLEDLEEDGWQLEAPVDGEFACLLNTSPKPMEQRRLAEAWAIVEAWEVSGTELEGWPGTDTEC